MVFFFLVTLFSIFSLNGESLSAPPKENISSQTKGSEIESLSSKKNHKKAPSIWIHTDSKNGILSAYTLILKMNEINRNIPILLTTNTIEGKNIADTFIHDNKVIKVCMQDDFEAISSYKQRMNAQVIILLDDNFPQNMLLFALLKKIPTYLFNVDYEYALRNRMEADPYFFTDLINKSVNQIYIKGESDKNFFQQLGINNPEYHTGNLDAFNALIRKRIYTKQCSITPEQLTKQFPNPVIFVNVIDANKIQIYLKIFKILRNIFPNVKIIFAREKLDFWVEELKLNLQSSEWRFSVIDEEHNFIDLNEKLITQLKKTYDENDILISTDPKNFFLLHAITTVYLSEGEFLDGKIADFMDAAVWKNAIMAGSFHNPSYSTEELEEQALNYTETELQQTLIKEIPILKFRKIADAIDTIVTLLDNTELHKALTQHSDNGLVKIAEETSEEISKFLDNLEEILYSSSPNELHKTLNEHSTNGLVKVAKETSEEISKFIDNLEEMPYSPGLLS